MVALHLICVFLNILLGFRPSVQFVTKDWQCLASAAKTPEIRTTLIIL